MHIQKHRSCVCIIFIAFNKSSFWVISWILCWLEFFISFFSSEKYYIWSIDLVINKEYTFVSLWFYKLGSTKQTQTQCIVTWADITWWDRQTWQGKLPLTCSLQVCRVIHAQNKLWWFSYNQRSNFVNHKLTKKQSYTFARNNFPVVFALSQCLPWCFLSSVVPDLTVLKVESSTSSCLKKYVSTTNVHISENVELIICSRLFHNHFPSSTTKSTERRSLQENREISK